MSRNGSITVYVDGANLFRRLLSGTSFLWLDVRGLMSRVLPGWEIDTIKYFTAEVRSSPHDPHKTARQRTYLEALSAGTDVEVYRGHFRRYVAMMPAHPWSFDERGKPVMVPVKQNREKGTDVSLASHLLWDGIHETTDAFVVVSNDSDFTTPITMLRERRNTEVGVVFPDQEASSQLRAVASWSRHIRRDMLRRSLLPNPVVDGTGREIWMPALWAEKSEAPE